MENFATYKLDQTGQQTQAILDQVSTNTADIAQLRALYEALTQSEPVIIQPSDTWPVADPQEKVIYRVIDRVNTPPQSYSDYMWNGNEMALMATYDNSIDNEPTPGSNNLVKSGGVAASIVFDISSYHATGSTLATYADLAAALGTDGANVPASVRKGGMSVKFVQSSDNKYVQYRLMADAWSTVVTDWQGVDNEPTAGSNNLVESRGVAIGIFDSQYKTEIALSWTTHMYSYINNGKVVTASASWLNVNLAKIDVSALVGQTLKIRSICSNGTPEYLARNAVADVDDNLLIEINLTPSNEVSYVTVPSGAKWLYLTNYPELSITEPYVKEGGDITGKIGKIDEKIEELAEKDKKNSGSLFFSQNPIPFIKDFLIDNTGDVMRFSNTNSNIYRYDVSSINDGASKILVYAKGLQDYYPDAYALGRFVIGGTIHPVPLVNQKYLDGYGIIVPQNAEYFDIAVLPINGVYYIQVCIDDNNLTALSPIVNFNELDRKLVVIKTQINDSLIEWIDNSFCDGSKNIGQSIALVSGYTAYRTAKIDVESYRGQTIGVYCISDTDYNQYVGSFMCDGNDKIIEKDLYMNEYTPMRLVYIRSDAKYLYLSNYKTYASSFKVGLIDFSSFEKLQNNVDELKGETIRNQWKNKKILWLGTSIPWGQSSEDAQGTHRVEHPYPYQVCEALDATLIDSTHGGLAQQAYFDEENQQWCPKPYTVGQTSTGGSTSLTVAECQAAVSLGYPDCSAFSYENTLLGKNADLYVLDVEPNNDADGSAEDLALFDWRLWKYTDNSTFASHRGSYIGALIYEIDQILNEKPNAVFVFIGEYVPMGLSDYNNPYDVRQQSLSICEKFHIHYIDLAEKLGYNGKNKDQWLNTDNVHPKRALYDRIAKILMHELMLIA